MKLRNCIALIVVALCMTFVFPMMVRAAEGSVSFGSESYTARMGTNFNIGVYLESTEDIGAYYVELEYDQSRVKYISGGDREENGIIYFEGTGFSNSIKYWLTFQPIGGGDAGIVVRTANLRAKESNGGQKLDVINLMFAPIKISGGVRSEPSFAEVLEQREAEKALEEANRLENRYPVLAAFQMDGRKYFLIDHEKYVPEDAAWMDHLRKGQFQEREVSFLTDKEDRVSVLYLMDEEEKFTPIGVDIANQKIYPVKNALDETGKEYLYVNGLACNSYPEEISEEFIREQNLVYAVDESGEAYFGQITLEGILRKWEPKPVEPEVDKPLVQSTETPDIVIIKEDKKIPVKGILAILALVASIGLFVYTLGVTKKRDRAQREIHERRNRLILEEEKRQQDKRISKSEDHLSDFQMISLDDELDLEIDGDEDAIYEPPKIPVISIQNVTMKFKISTSDASGLKEFLIQRFKKKVNYRELIALDNVSFDILKGEVVGIIGTNGSGKSTLLRIVSGALKPTKGKVVVDKSKIQLLTLGTGFDLELTARENVYLNGAIIGYSKQFLDEHYDEIVEFAELEGFMDEKVKNFSSGMISRLGFAIATAGDAAEILILDEVLSVGDEFFRRKSLARVKEMIHGGSTVLMVSHGMGTIIDNCTKVAWIEKGKLQMVGEPSIVCKEYQNKDKDK